VSNPLCSWTAVPQVADNFARIGAEGRYGAVLTMTVPASRILATATTGMGCLPEAEVLVLGGEDEASVIPIETGNR